MISTLKKLDILGASAKYDVCAATSVKYTGHSASGTYIGNKLPAGCCHVYLPSGQCISLFKVLLTNACSNDCYYCENSTSCTKKRGKTKFEPVEFTNLFLEFYKRNFVEGLFLSSGITGDPERVMSEMIDIGRLLREVHNYQGYIHMKVLPGCSLSSIKEIAKYADRLSLNIEAPSKAFLSEFSGTKDYLPDILTRLAWMHGVHKKVNLGAGLTTQIIVGGNEASDHDILLSTHRMYGHYGLKRVYYSAFHPIQGSPLSEKMPTPLLREHRLYQADWLLRCYGFSIGDVLPDKGENLPLEMDPKLYFAVNHYEALFPVDINEATYKQLLQVPGIGPRSARRVISLRKKGERIDRLSMLRGLGAVASRAEPFVKINGRRMIRLDEWVRKNKQEGVAL